MTHDISEIVTADEIGTEVGVPVARGVIHQAAMLLQAKHGICAITAYEQLVAAAVESHRNVRDTAYGVIDKSRREATLA